MVDQSFPVRVVELDREGVFRDPDGAFALRSHPTPHTDESIAVALEGPWGSFGYTGDSGPSREVADFFSECAILVAECTHPDPPPTDLHLTPDTLADLADRARPHLLVVTHVYPTHTPAEGGAAGPCPIPGHRGPRFGRAPGADLGLAGCRRPAAGAGLDFWAHTPSKPAISCS